MNGVDDAAVLDSLRSRWFSTAVSRIHYVCEVYVYVLHIDCLLYSLFTKMLRCLTAAAPAGSQTQPQVDVALMMLIIIICQGPGQLQHQVQS